MGATHSRKLLVFPKSGKMQKANDSIGCALYFVMHRGLAYYWIPVFGSQELVHLFDRDIDEVRLSIGQPSKVADHYAFCGLPKQHVAVTLIFNGSVSI